MAGYERGTVVPVAELRRHATDPAGLAAQRLGKGETAAAFFALEVARTMQFAGEMLVRANAKATATRVVDLRTTMEISGGEARCPEDAVQLCLRAGPELRVRGGADGPVARQLAADRSAREQAARDRFWNDFALLERRLAAFSEAQNVRSYRSIFHGRFVVPTAENAQLALAPDQAFVTYLVRDRVFAIVVTRKGTHQVTLPATPAELQEASRKLRAALLCPTYDKGQRLRHCGANWQQAWRKHAQLLHKLAWAPLQTHIGAARSVYLAPDGPLAHVPFAVLEAPDGTLELSRRRLTYLPSLSLLLSALNRERKQGLPSMLAIGDPEHDGAGTVRLPMAAAEAETVGGIFDGSATLQGKRADEGAVRAALGSHNVLHFATHGLASRSDPLLSALLLATGQGDGLLTADEIRWFDLSHLHVAVLSACETAVASDDGSGAGGLGSLVGSFLVAGAPSVIGSFWSVSDASTTLLMLRFYQAFLEVGASEALRQAQLALAQHPTFGHPYFWAAFSPWGIDG